MAGCAARTPPPAEPGPTGDRASDFVPADLDAVVRVDLDAARRFFGSGAVQALMFDVVDEREDAATSKLLSKGLDHASAVVVAFRPGLSSRATDHVIVFRGRFEDVDPRREPGSEWSPPRDLGAGFQVYERPQPRRRSAPARIYVRSNDWLVFVSSAEVDSAERVIERRADDPHVDPPDRGIVSYAFRAEQVGPLLAARFPAVAELLRGATMVSGGVSADDRGLRATLETVFTNDTDAAEAASRTTTVVAALRGSGRLLGVIASGTHVSAVGSTVVLRVELDARATTAVVECATSGKGC
jgi:hypothetical protein